MEEQNKRESRSSCDIVLELCDIILIKEDELDLNKTEEFIYSLTPEEKRRLNRKGLEERNKIHPTLMNRLLQYIRGYKKEDTQNGMYPFAFDSDGGFSVYCVQFERMYKKNVGSVSSNLPVLLEYTLCYIQEISDHYRVFGEFYQLHVQETSDMLLKKMKETVDVAKDEALENLSKEIENSVADAIMDAKDQADTSAQSAEQAALMAKQAEMKAGVAAELAVQEKMHKVTEHVSTTSVTILGIFASIVLTVVAGLIYSASVLESVSSANVHKLFLMATVVGFVCINILAAMFNYIINITKSRGADGKVEPSGEGLNYKQIWQAFLNSMKQHVFIVFVDVVLLIMMIVAVITYKEPLTTSDSNEIIDTQLEIEETDSEEPFFVTEN